MDPQTQPGLLERLADADDALAWREFFDRYWRGMFLFARGQGCSDNTAEEVVQQAVCSVFEQRQVFRYDPSRGRFRNWLFTIVRQKLALHRRSEARQHKDSPDAPPGDDARQTDEDPQQAWDRAFECTLLQAVLDVVRQEVRPETYQAFELVCLHGMDAARAAEMTSLSRNAVYQAHKRVMARLRELAGSYAADGALDERVRRALEAYPPPSVCRTMATRVEASLSRSRGMS